MSKRIVALLCAAAMLLVAVSFTGCGVKSTKTEVNGVKIEEQQYLSSGNNGVVLRLTNKTGNDCGMNVKVTFMDKEGKEVGTQTTTVIGFAKDSTVTKFVSAPGEFATCLYETEPELPEEDAISVPVSIDKDLKVKVQKKSDGATFTVTNKGKYGATNIEYCAVFYKGDKIVYCNSGECNSLIPGNSTNEAINTFMPYDKVKVYVHGVRYK